MTFTIKQFNKIALKSDLEDLRKGLVTKKEFNKKMDKLQCTMDYIKKSFDGNEIEKIANLEAHRRLGNNINEVRGEIGMKTISVV